MERARLKDIDGNFDTSGGTMRRLARTLLVVFVVMPGQALADEEGFLQSLQGNWLGKGMVKPRVGMPPVILDCAFETKARGLALSMNGTCRGLILVQRSLGASLRADGTRYSGTYVGPAGRRSALSGRRQGNAIRLSIRWSREVNGDRSADMVIQKIGGNGLKLSTHDLDPLTGKRVITSEINLKRE